ncbi:hypothetical protein E8E01_00435 [Methylorubrum populi]|uniref:DUF6894 family protein n=1 Tax=Methylorubrum populi TaxID=223967 RepID=UPI00114F3208|nr:hypothetical protein [Methylorubrum populi]QDI79022.1 hypothetical protein E8E01_00435 [Methylorubrum populi]
MPRYFFDIHDGMTVIDNFGRELPSIIAAKSEAMQIASIFATEPKMIGCNGGAIVINIREAPGLILATIRLVFSVEMNDVHES